mgnify:CR=1 FL=1
MTAQLSREPIYQVQCLAGWIDTSKQCYQAEHEAGRPARILYTAPPAPVAVPDERAAFEAFMSERFGSTIDRSRVKNGDGEYMAWDMQVAWIVWRRRAAMPNAGPVMAATVPDGWKLVPVEPTEAMLLLLGFTGSFEKMTQAYQKMLAAAPAAPEREV